MTQSTRNNFIGGFFFLSLSHARVCRSHGLPLPHKIHTPLLKFPNAVIYTYVSHLTSSIPHFPDPILSITVSCHRFQSHFPYTNLSIVTTNENICLSAHRDYCYPCSSFSFLSVEHCLLLAFRPCFLLPPLVWLSVILQHRPLSLLSPCSVVSLSTESCGVASLVSHLLGAREGNRGGGGARGEKGRGRNKEKREKEVGENAYNDENC